jgi:photosystem II stability/assembly factor-like uncharacterized protein
LCSSVASLVLAFFRSLLRWRMYMIKEFRPHILGEPMKLVLMLLWTGAACAQTWVIQQSGTKASLRGVSAVNAKVVWASGTGGTYLKTADGGAAWTAAKVPGAEALDFRDIQAVDEQTVYLLSSGSGDKSRIYKTSDGGGQWKLQFTNPDPKGFFDAMAFWDASHGIAVGDPVDGHSWC